MTFSILQGDCRALMRGMRDQSVHQIATSPPYLGLRDYGVAGQIGLEASVSDHMRVMLEVFEECWRVLRNDGTLWVNYGDAYACHPNGRSAKATKEAGDDDRTFRDKPFSTVDRAAGIKPKDLLGLPWMLAFALREQGWYLRRDIIWRKPNPMPESADDRPTSAHEYVFLLTKRARYFYDADAIRTPVKDVTVRRITQASFDEQSGGAKDGAAGGDHARSHRRALKNQRERLIASGAWSNRHDGYEAAKAAIQGANARSVWDIATEPFGGEFCKSCRTYFNGADKAKIRCEKVGKQTIRHCPCGESEQWLSHFATFPTELARRMIAAGSPTAVCSVCEAPHKRIRSKTFKAQGDVSAEKVSRQAHETHEGSRRSGSKRGSVEIKTLGFAPSCNCNAAAKPATVLDPFGGAGTVSIVAETLGRDSILCELNPDYVELAGHRIVAEVAKRKITPKRARALAREKKAPPRAPDLVDMMTKPARPKPTERIRAERKSKKAPTR